MKISTGKGYISLLALIAIWSVSAVTSLPGLAISPILEDLSHIFPTASELEVQMLTSLPSLLIIPFVLLAGWLSERGGESLKLLAIGLFDLFHALDGGVISHCVHAVKGDRDHAVVFTAFQHATGDLRLQTPVNEAVDLCLGK